MILVVSGLINRCPTPSASLARDLYRKGPAKLRYFLRMPFGQLTKRILVLVSKESRQIRKGYPGLRSTFDGQSIETEVYLPTVHLHGPNDPSLFA